MRMCIHHYKRFLYKETYAVLVKTHGMMLLHNTTYIGFVVVRPSSPTFNQPGRPRADPQARVCTSITARRQFWRTMDCWR
jgi:hypothetical protein